MVVGRAGPEADHVGTKLLDHVGRVDTVAEGLVHGLAFAVDGPAVGQAFFIGRAAVSREDWNQPLYWSPPSMYMSAGQKPWSRFMAA